MAATLKFTTPSRPLTWLITGCSSGLGLTLVRQVQSHGHTVIATSRNPAKTPDLVAEVESKGGKWLQLDIDDQNTPTLVADLEDKQGVHIDVLVNNAGWMVNNGAENLTEDEVRGQMETLFLGPYRLIRAVLPYMRRRRYGVIVNFSSGASLHGVPTFAAYSPPKAALDNLSLVLANEVASFNVRVVCVSLGTFNTNMGNAVKRGSEPLDPDYKGTMVEGILGAIFSGQLPTYGDSNKGMKVVYEVVMGEGVGTGHEAEKFLPLGREVGDKLKELPNVWNHTSEVFGKLSYSVELDK